VTTTIKIIEADLNDPAQGESIVSLIDAYAQDPMGGGRPLPSEVTAKLMEGLRSQPGGLVLLAYCGDEPVGVAVCFRGFSTFAAKPLINIHDLAVKSGYRGRGIGRQLLDRVADAARRLGCCKVTLEVREDNVSARRLYEQVGFQSGAAPMQFLVKPLGG
jgi:GNAT superfamily N-acetyltransferase